MSRNLTDYAIMPSLASRILRNFTDCALTRPFNSRHVIKLHGLPNDGCQVPRSGQVRVTPQQTDDPWTKLGYEKSQSEIGNKIWTSIVLNFGNYLAQSCVGNSQRSYENSIHLLPQLLQAGYFHT